MLPSRGEESQYLGGGVVCVISKKEDQVARVNVLLPWWTVKKAKKGRDRSGDSAGAGAGDGDGAGAGGGRGRR